MNYKTHLAFGFLMGLLTLKFAAPINKYLFFAFVLLGSILPDIDTPESKINSKLKITKILGYIFKHRGLFHSIFFALLIPGLIYYYLSKPIGLALFIGYLSHLIIDSFTVAGINYLNPIAKWHHSGFIETGSIAETAVLISLIVVIGTILIF